MTPVVLCLPIADRARSFAFYATGLGLPVVGEIGDDGLPEPMQLAIGDDVRVMLIPSGGFGWVIGGREVAGPGRHECVVALTLGDDGAVDELVARARAAGAEVVTPAGPQPWGYLGVFADPDGHLWQITSIPAPG